MPRPLFPAFASLLLALTVQADVIRGVLLNDDEMSEVWVEEVDE